MDIMGTPKPHKHNDHIEKGDDHWSFWQYRDQDNVSAYQKGDDP